MRKTIAKMQIERKLKWRKMALAYSESSQKSALRSTCDMGAKSWLEYCFLVHYSNEQMPVFLALLDAKTTLKEHIWGVWLVINYILYSIWTTSLRLFSGPRIFRCIHAPEIILLVWTKRCQRVNEHHFFFLILA